ncbi:MAG: hypothetical protein M2R45_04531 [Verrucomicrobia subdivision 3 bacterium]|nr:hypothetical protein [Limisphaerales bacterium]MCS1416830.1 hypothetical protein [Limisphaerales bacterium]
MLRFGVFYEIKDGILMISGSETTGEDGQDGFVFRFSAISLEPVEAWIRDQSQEFGCSVETEPVSDQIAPTLTPMVGLSTRLDIDFVSGEQIRIVKRPSSPVEPRQQRGSHRKIG